jgi:hypothetical protein
MELYTYEELIKINHQLYIANQEWTMASMKRLLFTNNIKQIRSLFKEAFTKINQLEEKERIYLLLKLVKEGKD